MLPGGKKGNIKGSNTKLQQINTEPEPVADKVIVKRVERMARYGLTLNQIASLLGTTPGRFLSMRDQFPEYEEAIQRGRAKSVEKVAKSLYNSAIDGNIKAQMFFLKNMAPEAWKEKHEVIQETTLNIENISTEDLDDKIKQLIFTSKNVREFAGKAETPTIEILGGEGPKGA